MKPKILFSEIEPWEREYLRSKLRKYKPKFIKEKILPKTAGKYRGYNIISTFIYSKIDKQAIQKLKNLKFIATRSTGFDHIDIKECKKRKILVSNVPHYGENTVAEHTFALILSLSRKIFQSYERTERCKFGNQGLQGFDLKGKTIGIIGCGRIGSYVAKIAVKGFGMKVIAYDKFKNKELIKELGLKYTKSLKELLENSDVITLHLVLNEKTYHIINRHNIKYIKKGAILINTARGPLVETIALLKALDEGILSGAGLDVLEEEKNIKEELQLLRKNFETECDYKTLLQNHMLIARDDVIITPHNAFNSKEAIKRILDTTIENIKSFIQGNPENLVK